MKNCQNYVSYLCLVQYFLTFYLVVPCILYFQNIHSLNFTIQIVQSHYSYCLDVRRTFYKIVSKQKKITHSWIDPMFLFVKMISSSDQPQGGILIKFFIKFHGVPSQVFSSVSIQSCRPRRIPFNFRKNCRNVNGYAPLQLGNLGEIGSPAPVVCCVIIMPKIQDGTCLPSCTRGRLQLSVCYRQQA